MITKSVSVALASSNSKSVGESVKKHSVKKRNARQKRISQCLVKICRLIIVALLAVIGIRAWALYSQRSGSTNEVIPSSPVSLFRPTIVNRAPAPKPVPAGMVWIPGGEFSMGANDPPDMDQVGMKATTDARPVHRV